MPDMFNVTLAEEAQSCRSEEGITVGLVDAVIGIVRVLAPRDLSTGHVQEALADLFEDPDLRTVRDARRRFVGVGPMPESETEFAVRAEYGEIIPRPSQEAAQRTVDGIRSRGGLATLISRTVVRSDWEEVET
jgi:hypothetical protein